jgi:uncharacterized OB-fold protein
VSNGVPIQVCSRCGRRAFPHRLACAACGSRDFGIVEVTDGTLEEVTLVHRAPGRSLEAPVCIATALLAPGPRVVARVEGRAERGARVRLRMEDGGPIAA